MACVYIKYYSVTVARGKKNNTFVELARFNALGARETIIKFKQGGDFIFPQRYIILYILVRVYKYILFKRSETEEMPSRDPATY